MSEEVTSTDTLINLIKNPILQKAFVIATIVIFTIYLYIQKNNFYIISAIILTIFIIFLILDYFMNKRLKKCPNYKEGICIRTSAENEDSQKKISYSIITNIKKIINHDKYNIKFIELPYNQVKITEDMNTKDILNNTNCKLLIDIKQFSSGEKYKTQFNVYGKDIHIDNIDKLLNKILYKENSISYTSENMIETIENLSEIIAIISEYIVSYFYCSNKDYEKAISLLEDIIKEIEEYNFTDFKEKIYKIIHLLSINFAWLNYTDYMSTRDSKYIDKAELYTLKSNDIYPDNYSYIALNIRIKFLKHRDCQYGLNAYKNIHFKKYNELDSLLNLGFIYSYLNEKEIKIIYTYIDAFRKLKNSKIPNKEEHINSIFTFIFDFMSEEEIDGCNLHLALSLLYLELNNTSKFKYHLNKYLNVKNIKNINPYGATILENKYNIRLNDFIEK